MDCMASASALCPLHSAPPLWQRERSLPGRGGEKGIVGGLGCGHSRRSLGRNAMGRQVVLRREIYGNDGGLVTRSRSLGEKGGPRKAGSWVGIAHASLLADPAVWVVRTAIFYVLLQTGVAARSRPLQELEEGNAGEGGPLAWIQNLIGPNAEQQRAKDLNKVRRQWHASTKGTLVRKYRVPSKSGGRKLLTAISSLLADDDTFRDVATSKGCQIRRENAHAESVCGSNVRALFDELPTPHLVVEITVFPPGPITEAHFEKAAKLEKVLRTGASI